MKKSLKVKILLWFFGALLLVSVLALIGLYSISKTILIQDQTTNIRVASQEFSKKLSHRDGQLTVSVGAHFYERGVYRCVFSSTGTLLQGTLPDAVSTIPVSFSHNTVREREYKGNYYLEYDTLLTLDNTAYWVKGIALLNDEMRIIRSTVNIGAVLIFVLLTAAVIGVYFSICRALSPVENIRKTAVEIAQSNDLSRRIHIGAEKDEIHALANTFDEMLDRLEEAFRREKQFSADVSHELRTPITVILSECEYAKTCAQSGEDHTEALDAIDRQAQRMQNLVSDLLTVSRMENQTIQIDFEETDISELLTFVCQEQAAIQDPKIQLVTDITPGITASVDRELLIRLFINLIANAYQYSKETGTIYVTLKAEGSDIQFSVRDTGIGIAKENIHRIWDRFYRADPSRNSNTGSTGLGLSMAKWIAQCHNGQLQVESTLGEGSMFSFTFASNAPDDQKMLK